MPGIPDRVRAMLTPKHMLWRHRQANQFNMAHDECLELIAPPEHIELLKTASSVANVSYSNTWVSLSVPCTADGVQHPSVCVYMHAHNGEEPPLTPRLPVWRHNAHSHIKTKVIDWLNSELHNSRMAATTKFVIDWLAENCDNGTQVRYLWPAIVHTFDGIDDERARKWLDANSAYKPARTVPAVPPYVRKAMQETSTWVTQSILLKDILTAKTTGVMIAIGHQYEFELSEDVILTRAE